jgi:ATP-dependent protease HslVU (ClpYQ) peptidase subunit
MNRIGFSGSVADLATLSARLPRTHPSHQMDLQRSSAAGAVNRRRRVMRFVERAILYAPTCVTNLKFR